MKNAFKRVLSLIVVAALLITGVSTGVSAVQPDAQETHSCEHSPVIILPGINHSPTYLYDENDEPVLDENGSHIGGTLLILNVQDLLKKCLAPIIFSVLSTLVFQRSVGLEKVAYKAASTAFSYQRCDDNGDHVENLKTQRWNHSLEGMTDDELEWVYRMVPMKPLVDVIGEDHVYFFTFNLVGDPMDSADELDDYIEMVKEQTGHDKVTLLPVSLGGTILTAYLDKYGHEKVDSIVSAVACLNGTDIVADMMAREWNLSDEYLYHEYIASIMKESNDYGTLGYVINIALHLFPSEGIDALLTGAISGILDTLMTKCPQIWAMIPSYRYDALAARYLSDKPVLKERTDRFQQARLNLEDNIEAAVADGVEVNLISGSNLDFGEGEYSFFGIVASAKEHNTDGIINLTSTTLGATGLAGDETFAEDYTQAYTNPDYPEYSYISPDRKIDVSTSVLPDNTWIFLDQHHEVGNNDVVLNLAKAIILGEVTDVHDDPETYPQFNYTCNTKYIRRWRIPDAQEVLRQDAEGEITLSAEDKAELIAAIEQGEKVLASTIADAEAADAADERLINILVKVGYMGAPEEGTKTDVALEKITGAISYILVLVLGGGSVFDALFNSGYRR